MRLHQSYHFVCFIITIGISRQRGLSISAGSLLPPVPCRITISRRALNRNGKRSCRLGPSYVVNARLLAPVNGEPRDRWASRRRYLVLRAYTRSGARRLHPFSMMARPVASRFVSRPFSSTRFSRSPWVGQSQHRPNRPLSSSIPTRIPDLLGRRKGRAGLKPVKWN